MFRLFLGGGVGSATNRAREAARAVQCSQSPLGPLLSDRGDVFAERTSSDGLLC